MMQSSQAAMAPPPKPKRTVWKIAAALVVVLIVAAVVKWRTGLPPGIPFASYGDGYAAKMDFAEVEHEYPLTPAQRMALTPANIQKYSQEQVDQIYARLTAGPIPDGPHDGDLFFPKGSTGGARLGEILGGLKGLTADIELAKLTVLGRALWKGKVFYRDQRLLRNRIDHLELLQDFFPDASDAAALRRISVHGHTDQLYFPAKLYCGQSLLDSRKESIIIDYAFTDEIQGYTPVPDKLAGREMLIIRDEIRMVRPGFYLGRAYMAGSFLLNFTVYNDAAAKAGSDNFLKTGTAGEDCWTGPQNIAQ